MLTQLSFLRSNHLDAHLKNILILLRRRWTSLSRLGLLRNVIPWMVGQYSGSKEEKWKVASMHGFHRLEQGLSKGPFPHASDQSASGRNCRTSSDELFGCFLRVPPNTTGFKWSKEDNFCHPHRKLPLQSDAFWFKECGGYLQKDDDQDVRATARKKH